MKNVDIVLVRERESVCECCMLSSLDLDLVVGKVELW